MFIDFQAMHMWMLAESLEMEVGRGETRLHDWVRGAKCAGLASCSALDRTELTSSCVLGTVLVTSGLISRPSSPPR